jgi:hypothetical protein
MQGIRLCYYRSFSRDSTEVTFKPCSLAMSKFQGHFHPRIPLLQLFKEFHLLHLFFRRVPLYHNQHPFFRLSLYMAH